MEVDIDDEISELRHSLNHEDFMNIELDRRAISRLMNRDIISISSGNKCKNLLLRRYKKLVAGE